MMRQIDLISDGYRGLQMELHSRPEGYGDAGDKWAPAVLSLATALQASSVLDYGCGQGRLMAALRLTKPAWVRVDEYDPSIEGLDAPPTFADLVVCTDVLEHVEPEKLDAVLKHLRSLARIAIFAVIATRPSSRTLADGRNAHLIIEQTDWWTAKLTVAGFTIMPGPASPHPKPSRELSVVLT